MTTRIIFGAVTAAALLAGCSSGTSSPPAAAPSRAATASTLTCKQRYLAWKNGPDHAAADQFIAAEKGLRAAGSKKDIATVIAAVKREGQAAARFARYPVPACADPQGYLAELLGRIRTAAANAGTAKDLSTLVQAMAPLKQISTLESEFTAEVKRTTGI
jgi:outer membrane murein-binding lipoprotein Lpp